MGEVSIEALSDATFEIEKRRNLRHCRRFWRRQNDSSKIYWAAWIR